MKILFFLNFLISLAIAILLFVNFFKNNEHKKTRKITNYLSFVGVLYAIMSLFSFLWFFDFLIYSENDFLSIYALITIIQSAFLFAITYLLSGNKKLFYFLFFYLIIFVSFFLSVYNFLYLCLITSFLLTLLFFVALTFRIDVYKKVGYFGIFYSSLSLIFQIFSLFRAGSLYMFSFFSMIIFLILVFIFVRDLKKSPPVFRTHIKKYEKKPYALTFLRYFVFILVLTNFVFIATITLHELGHFTLSKFYDCQYRRIVYEENLPHTEILCKDLFNSSMIILGGIFLPFLLAIFLFIVGGKFLKEIAFLILGFNLIASNKDFLDLGMSDNLVVATIIFGALLLIAGIIMLAKSRTEEQVYE